MSLFSKFVLIYFTVISFVAVVMTILDKSKAKRNAWRIPEATLMLVGLFGGATAMYATMKAIRHKTKHKKFMIGLPLEILLHVAVVCFVIFEKFNVI